MFNYVFVFNTTCLQTDTTEKSPTTTFSQFCHSVCGPSVSAVETDFFASVSRQIVFSFAFTTSAILLFCLFLY